MYKIKFKDSKYNELNFVCEGENELMKLVGTMFKYTTDEQLSFTGTQVINPCEELPTDLEDDLAAILGK